MSSDDTELCPLCFRPFPLAELPEHSSGCRGADGADAGAGADFGDGRRVSGGRGGGGGRGGVAEYRPEGGNCKGGCGFFGNPDLGGFCSSCAKKLGGGFAMGGGRGGGLGGGFSAPYKPGPIPVTIKSTTVNGIRVEIKKGDLVQERVDALVNAANKRLDHASGVAGAIRKFGGQAIQDVSDVYFQTNGELREGDAIVAGPEVGNLHCKVLIHAVGPVWSSGRKDDVALLKQAVVNSLMIAEDQQLKTICIPAISSGIFGFPKPLCATTLFQAVKEFSTKRKTKWVGNVRFTNIDEETVSCFVDAVPANKVALLRPLVGGRQMIALNGTLTEEDGVYVDSGNLRFEPIGAMPEAWVPVLLSTMNELSPTLGEDNFQDPTKPGVFRPGTVLSTSGPLFGGFTEVAIVTTPVFDFTEGTLAALRQTVKGLLTWAEVHGHAKLVMPVLGQKSLAYPHTIAARVQVEEVHAFMTSPQCERLQKVVFIEPTSQGYFTEALQRVQEDGVLADAPPIQLPTALAATPAAPPNETPAERRKRERAAAEIRLAQQLASESKIFEESASKQASMASIPPE